MNDAYRGQVIAKLFKIKHFHKAPHIHQLIVLYIISRTNFDPNHRTLKGKLSEFGECELTYGELCEELTGRFSSDSMSKAVGWAIEQRFLSTKSLIPEFEVSNGFFTQKTTKDQNNTEIENIHIRVNLQKNLDEKLCTNPPFQCYLCPLHIGERVLVSVKFRCSWLENSGSIVENFVHNLEILDKNRENSEKIQKSLIPPPLPFPLTIPIPLPPPGALLSPNPNQYKKGPACSTCARGGDPATSATETEAPEPGGNGTQDPERERVISPQNGVTGNVVAMWQNKFPELDVFAELELFEAHLQESSKKRNSIKDLKSYVYGYLRSRAKEKGILEDFSENASLFICLEKEVEGRFGQEANHDNQTQKLLYHENYKPLTAPSKQEVEQWRFYQYQNNLPKIALEVCALKLFHPHNILKTITKFVRTPGKCLTIQGPSGSGKSYISILTTREMFRRKIECMYITASDLRKYSKQTGSALDDFRNKLCVAPLLVVEDVSFEIKHYAFVEMLCCVINSRMGQQNRPTILTTHLRPAVLFQALGSHLATMVAAETWIILK